MLAYAAISSLRSQSTHSQTPAGFRAHPGLLNSGDALLWECLLHLCPAPSKPVVILGQGVFGTLNIGNCGKDTRETPAMKSGSGYSLTKACTPEWRCRCRSCFPGVTAMRDPQKAFLLLILLACAAWQAGTLLRSKTDMVFQTSCAWWRTDCLYTCVSINTGANNSSECELEVLRVWAAFILTTSSCGGAPSRGLV